MTAVAGDIEFTTFKIGELDLNDPKQAKKLEMNIYYDILRPVVLADVTVLDESDALGTYKISGKEDVEIGFGVPGGESINLKLKLFENKNMHDNTVENKGAMKHKTYELRMVSPELLKNQSTRVQKSFKEPTHDIVKKALKEISDKEVETPDETKGDQRIIANYEKSFDFVKNIRTRHVSQKYKSSAYTLFPTYDGGTEKYMFCTFEYLMDQPSKYEFKQDATVGHRTTTDGDQMSNILWATVPDSFHTPTRFDSASNRSTYNMHTGKQQAKDNKDTKFVILGQETFSDQEKQEIDGVKVNQKPIRKTIIDPSNDKKKTEISDAKTDRARFVAHLSQNTIKFEIHGNPDIKVGDVVTLNLPKKSDADQESGETQMNDKVLIVRLRHRIRPVGTTPRYTMIVEAIKAGFKEGV
jgi:hypothetical protein